VAYAEGKGFLSPIDEILEDLRNGRMIILVDAEDRENEGDLVVAAQMATPETINFMAKHGRGLICLSLTKQRADQLRLEYMARQNEARKRTAFTVSIEAREGVATGISAHDRARTIATAIDPTKDHNDIVSPGHVFPLIAREGGVLVRAGHTEASVDLARLAGLYPAGVICEIMNDDGTMARMPDLVAFAQRHGLKIGTIEDLIGYRLKHDRIVRRVAKSKLESAYGGPFELHVYETTVEPVEHLALVKGDLHAPGPVPVRVHAVDPLVDLLGMGEEGVKGSLIERSMRLIAHEGRGVVVLIRNLRPKSVSDWLAQNAAPKRPNKADDERRQVEIGIGSQILRDLGVSDMVLLSNAPPSRYVGLEAFGLRIVGHRKIE
jgi:3,4-dihydroxy 2-butanone 4-phosphate synthase/GTP cyclohydrolase II